MLCACINAQRHVLLRFTGGDSKLNREWRSTLHHGFSSLEQMPRILLSFFDSCFGDAPSGPGARVSTLYDTRELKARVRKGVLGKLPMEPARTEDDGTEDEEGRPHTQADKDACTNGRRRPGLRGGHDRRRVSDVACAPAKVNFAWAQSQGAFSSQATPSSFVKPSRLPAFVWMQTKRMP